MYLVSYSQVKSPSSRKRVFQPFKRAHVPNITPQETENEPQTGKIGLPRPNFGRFSE